MGRWTGDSRRAALNTTWGTSCILVALAIAIVLASAAHSQQDMIPAFSGPSTRLAVTVLWFEDRTGDPEQAHWRYTAPGLLKRQLRHVKAIRLLSDGAVDYALRQIGLHPGDAIDPNRVRRVGEYIEAQRVIWGHYTKKDARWQASVRVMHVATGRASQELSTGAEDWFDVRDELSRQILAELAVTPNERERRQMAERWTRSAETLHLCGQAFMLQEEGKPVSQGEAFGRKATAADPNCALAYSMLAAMLANQGKFGPAEDAVRYALKLDPNDAVTHSILGFVLAAQGQRDQARSQFQQACRLDRDDATFPSMIARLDSIEGKWNEAAASLGMAVALDPTDATAHASLARAYAAQKLSDKALYELSQAIHFMREGFAAANATQVIAETYEMLDRPSEATDYYERLVSLAERTKMNPNSVRAFRNRIERLKAGMSPQFVDAAMPEWYTPEALEKALQEKLTADDRRYVTNPFECTEPMKQWAQQLTGGTVTDMDKARAIFNALSSRAGASGFPSTRTAREVFALWNNTEAPLLCGDHTVLFIALARAVGVKAFFTYVGKGPDGNVIHHACATVFADGRTLLVDPAWHWFGIPHRQFLVLDDLRTVAMFCFLGDSARTVASCQVGLKLYPDSLFGQLSLVNLLREADRMEEADNLLKAIPEPREQSWETYLYHLLQGIVAGSRGNDERAAQSLRAALSTYPEGDAAHYFLGLILEKRWQLREARDRYREALRCLRESGLADEIRGHLAQVNERIGVGPVISEPGEALP